MISMRRLLPWASLGVVLLAGIAVLASYTALSSSGKSSGPSIVLIIIDTLRADKLGIYGSPSPASKELDQVAAKGVVFERAISQASWTRSSVASMITGLSPLKTGVRKEKWDQLPFSMTTLAERLKGIGYTTIGLTANPQLNRDFQFEQGFDHYSESTVIFPWMKTADGKIKATRDSLVRSGDEMLTEATRLMRDGAGKAPIYLQVLIMDVHAHHRIKIEEVDDDLKDFPDAAYLQSVRRATQPVAKFINEVDQMLKGDVVFFVVADHGEGLQDHPSVLHSRGHGNLLYRSQIHVPLMVIEGSASTRFTSGVRSHLTQLLDIVPTVMEIATGTQFTETVDGHSLIPILKDSNTESVNAVAFSETIWRQGVRKSAVVTPEWFLIRSKDAWQGTQPEELHPFYGPQDGGKDSSFDQNPTIAEELSSKLNSILTN